MSTEIIDTTDYEANTVLNRAKIAFKVSSDAKLSSFLGYGKTTISSWRSKGVIPYEGLFWLCRANQVNLDWVITGRGDIYKTTEKTVDDKVSESIAVYSVDSEFIAIPFYKVDISAGNGNNPTDEEEFKPLIFRREFFENLGLTPDNLIGANVPGDSMEPLIPANSGILIDKTDQKMTDGKIYVFNADGNLLVKKIILF